MSSQKLREIESTLKTLLEATNKNSAKIEAAIVTLDAKFDGLTNRLNKMEEKTKRMGQAQKELKQKIQACEGTSEHCYNVSKALVKENKIIKRQLELIENQVRSLNIRIVGLAEEYGQENLVEFMETWIPKILQIDVKEDPIVVERAFRNPMRPGKNVENRRTVVVTVSSIIDKDRIMVAACKAKELNYGGNRISFFPDLSQGTLLKCKALQTVKKGFLNDGIQASLLYPSKLRVVHDGKIYIFWEVLEAEKLLHSIKKKLKQNEQEDSTSEDTD
uniref:L1 transposable element RRM domain-containing protein n=1 Tax=Latimeria chalumnae TaxID=7897 RepID=H2ZYA9_LATCH